MDKPDITSHSLELLEAEQALDNYTDALMENPKIVGLGLRELPQDSGMFVIVAYVASAHWIPGIPIRLRADPFV